MAKINDKDNVNSPIDVYRRHVSTRNTYISQCAIVHSELRRMDEQAVKEIVSTYLSNIPINQFVASAIKNSVATNMSELMSEVEMALHIDSIEVPRTDDHTDIVQPKQPISYDEAVIEHMYGDWRKQDRFSVESKQYHTKMFPTSDQINKQVK